MLGVLDSRLRGNDGGVTGMTGWKLECWREAGMAKEKVVMTKDIAVMTEESRNEI